MDVAIQIKGKKVVKVLGAVCLATGVVALSAVVASGAAVGAVVEGFKSARGTMQKILKKEDNSAADGVGEVSTSAVEEVTETATASQGLAEEGNVAEDAEKEA